ncbi:MAG: hypothetical protein JW957_00815 [Candidatus Omnitrophica bacterium]|nr:hypothetical protein [Candidatus Omnitrophota bacterium]
MMYLSILWHMHQPYYADVNNGEIDTPALTFRTLFNYYPMAVLTKKNPGIKLNFNLTPVLLIQIEDIASGKIKDRFMALLEEGNSAGREEVLAFIGGMPPQILGRHKIINMLKEKAEENSCSEQDLLDLKIYLHLASFHPAVSDGEIKELFKKGRNFGESDRKLLHEKEKMIFSEVIALYGELMNEGKIEISTSPMMHPILPLLYSTDTARKTKTSLSIPEGVFSYPQDARMQLLEGLKTYERIFKKQAAGIWPSEGSLSDEILELFSEQGVLWTATDESLLEETLAHPLFQKEHCSIWDFRNGPSVFFRDRHISDMIGFSYQKTDEKNAAGDIAERLSALRSNMDGRLLTVILDGENPWDFYPDYGEKFLTAFYKFLENNDAVRTVTFSEALKTDIRRLRFDHISPGSWMGTNFDNWIGREPANKAWSILKQARAAAEERENCLPEEKKNILAEAVMLAESSDWFWWYSLPADKKTKMRFDAYFRNSIRRIYETAGAEIPQYLNLPVEGYAYEEIIPYIKPVIDGKITHFYEWHDAIELDPSGLWATFMPAGMPVRKMFYGYDEENLYIRMDFKSKEAVEIQIYFHEPVEKKFIIHTGRRDAGPVIYSCGGITEMLIPKTEILAGDEENTFFNITVRETNGQEFVMPAGDFFKVRFTPKDENWTV